MHLLVILAAASAAMVSVSASTVSDPLYSVDGYDEYDQAGGYGQHDAEYDQGGGYDHQDAGHDQHEEHDDQNEPHAPSHSSPMGSSWGHNAVNGAGAISALASSVGGPANVEQQRGSSKTNAGAYCSKSKSAKCQEYRRSLASKSKGGAYCSKSKSATCQQHRKTLAAALKKPANHCTGKKKNSAACQEHHKTLKMHHGRK